MSARTLNNLFAFAVGFFLAFVVGFAYADTIPATQQTVDHFAASGQFCPGDPSPAAYSIDETSMPLAQSSAASQWPGCTSADNVWHSTPTGSAYSGFTVTLACTLTQNGVFYSTSSSCRTVDLAHTTTTEYTCPSGYTLDAGGTTCTLSTCAAKAGTTAASGYFDWGTDPTVARSSAGCSGGCKATFTGSFPEKRALVNGVYHYFASGQYTYWDVDVAESCTSEPSATGVPALPAPTCATGQTMGQVNGQDVCLASGGTVSNPYQAPAPKTATTTKNTVDNGNGTTTETTTTTYPDGSTKTDVKTTTTATGATSTTSTTSGGSGGAPRQADTNGQPTDKLTGICESNPSLPICKGDMATETTQKQIKDALSPDMTGYDNTLSAEIANNNQAYADRENVIKGVGDGGLDAHGVTWDWNPVIPAATCAPWTFGVTGHMYTWEVCPVAEKIRDIFGYIIYVGTAFVLFNIFTESNKGA